VRGGFIVYPLIYFYEQIPFEEQCEQPNKKIVKQKNNKSKVMTNEKMIVKGNIKIYSFWEQKKKDIKLFVRLSFAALGNTQPKRKDVLLKYNLEIIENDKNKIKPKTIPKGRTLIYI
jgi:hypothetical protein